MKKNLFITALFFTTCTFFSCQKQSLEPAANQQTSGDDNIITGRETMGECLPTVVTLIAGQSINAGTVTVSNDADYVYVTYSTANGYHLTQTHLYVGDCALIPVTNAGNPIPGQFPYSGTHNNADSYTYQVPLSAFGTGTCGCIAAHAVVVKLNAAGQVIDTQTGWGNGTRINPNGGNWGMSFGYCTCTP